MKIILVDNHVHKKDSNLDMAFNKKFSRFIGRLFNPIKGGAIEGLIYFPVTRLYLGRGGRSRPFLDIGQKEFK